MFFSLHCVYYILIMFFASCQFLYIFSHSSLGFCRWTYFVLGFLGWSYLLSFPGPSKIRNPFPTCRGTPFSCFAQPWHFGVWTVPPLLYSRLIFESPQVPQSGLDMPYEESSSWESKATHPPECHPSQYIRPYYKLVINHHKSVKEPLLRPYLLKGRGGIWGGYWPLDFHDTKNLQGICCWREVKPTTQVEVKIPSIQTGARRCISMALSKGWFDTTMFESNPSSTAAKHYCQYRWYKITLPPQPNVQRNICQFVYFE